MSDLQEQRSATIERTFNGWIVKYDGPGETRRMIYADFADAMQGITYHLGCTSHGGPPLVHIATFDDYLKGGK